MKKKGQKGELYDILTGIEGEKKGFMNESSKYMEALLYDYKAQAPGTQALF